MLKKHLIRLAGQYPVVTVTGPRQSGKTTLVRAALKNRSYASLEDPEIQEFAENDPRGFLNQFPEGAILDEIQRVPKLLSYIQGIVDDKSINGMFILTGSQQLLLLDKITQSLAGRSALLTLFPLSYEEIRKNKISINSLDELILKGSYPRIYDKALNPGEWYANYSATYTEEKTSRREKMDGFFHGRKYNHCLMRYLYEIPA